MQKRIFLRHLEISDCQRVYQWHNDPELYSTLINPFHPVSLQTVEDWIKRKSQYSDKEINFAICLADTSEHIGNLYMRDIDFVNRNCSVGAFIASPKNRGKGYVQEALDQLVEYAYETLGLKRVYMHTFADNERAVKLLRKCGFTIEGKMRQHVFKNGRFKDVLILGMCESDYVEYKKKKKCEIKS